MPDLIHKISLLCCQNALNPCVKRNLTGSIGKADTNKRWLPPSLTPREMRSTWIRQLLEKAHVMDMIEQIAEITQELPPDKQTEVLDFVAFLVARQAPTTWTVETRQAIVANTIGVLDPDTHNK